MIEFETVGRPNMVTILVIDSRTDEQICKYHSHVLPRNGEYLYINGTEWFVETVTHYLTPLPNIGTNTGYSHIVKVHKKVDRI